MSIKRPEKCVYPNCFECTYADCKYNGVESKEIRQQDKFDKELDVIEPEKQNRRSSQKKYNATDKGRERQSRYNNSDKGKASRKRYSLTEKGKENEKRKKQEKINNGKNAEYCRRYYYKKKLQMQNN